MFFRVELTSSTLIFILSKIVLAALRINSLDSFINSIFQFLVNVLMRCLFTVFFFLFILFISSFLVFIVLLLLFLLDFTFLYVNKKKRKCKLDYRSHDSRFHHATSFIAIKTISFHNKYTT